MEETPSFAMNSLAGKKALGLVRGEDFAHAGEREAIELVFKHLPKESAQRVLDVGSGLGATADAIRHEGWGKVTGIELDRSAVVYANERYPRCDFVCADVADAAQLLPPGFSVIVSFNAFYAFAQQGKALEALAAVATSDAQLAIFDYVDRDDYLVHPILENGQPFLPNPLHLDKIEHLLERHGWNLFTIEPLHPHFGDWYDDLVERIQAKEKAIREATPDGFFEHMLGLYTQLRDAIHDNRLGGAIVRATRHAES